MCTLNVEDFDKTEPAPTRTALFCTRTTNVYGTAHDCFAFSTQKQRSQQTYLLCDREEAQSCVVLRCWELRTTFAISEIKQQQRNLSQTEASAIMNSASMFPQEVANLLSQCVLVVDNAKSPVHSATARAEPLPSLSPYKRTMKAKRATRRNRSSSQQQSRSPKNTLERLVAPACRWTADSWHSLHHPKQVSRSSILPAHQDHHDEVSNTSPRKPSPTSIGETDSLRTLLQAPQRIRRSKSLTSSPRMPSRKASFRIPKSLQSPNDAPPKAPVDTSPRMPQRRSFDTADLLQEALDSSVRLCDLSQPEGDDDDGSCELDKEHQAASKSLHDSAPCVLMSTQ